MNILHIGPPTSKVNAVESDNIFRQKYPELFNGVGFLRIFLPTLGKLNDYELTIHTDKM